MTGKFEIYATTPDKAKKLAEELKNRGVENVEVKSELEAWAKEQEHKVEEGGGTPELRIAFEIDRARLYAAADRYDEALETLEWARYAALQEGRLELAAMVDEEINSIIGLTPTE